MRPRYLAVPAMLTLLSLALFTTAAAQTGVVRGRVTDVVTGLAVGGARAMVTGTSLVAASDAAGEYVLRAVPAGTREIVLQRVGFAPARQTVEVPAGETVTVDFALRAAAVSLDAIVVTGVGAPAEKRVLGNTVDIVAGDAVSEAPAATAIDQALQGKVTGAWISQNSGVPGGGVSVRLRGTNSILGGSEPLWVVDGVIVDNSSDALVNMSANATGARREVGGAGVTNRLADLAPEDIERIEVLKGAAAAALYGSRANNGVIQVFTKRGGGGAQRVTLSTEMGFGETPARYAVNMAPTAGWADSTFLGIPLGGPVTRYDVQDQIFRTAPRAATHLSFSGGDDRTAYYLSGSRASMDGIVRSQTWGRTHILGRITQQVSSRFELTASATYIDSHQELIPEGEQTQGALTSVVFTPTAWNPSFNATLGGYPYNPVLGPNPLTVINQLESSDDVTRFMGSLQSTLRLTPSLTMRYLVGLDDYRQEVRYLQPSFSLSPTFTGSIQNPLRMSRKMNHDFTATLLSRLSDAIGANTTAGFRYASDKLDDVRAAGSNLSPEQQTVGGAVLSASQSLSELRTVGGFVEERLSVADRLFLTGGLNLEASSAFGADNRWQLFPRIGVSYLLGETDFFRSSGVAKAVSSLRLRAAYGQTGGQPPGAYTRFSNYVDIAHSGKPGLVTSTTAGNPQLRPERQREIEAGLDIGMLASRADLELTFYDKRTYDLVLAVPQAPSSGSQSRLENVGELSNRGWEAALRTVNVDQPSLRWRSTLSLSHNRNRVEKLNTAADTLIYGYLNAVIEGQPIGAFYGGTYARNADGSIFYAPVTVPVYGSVLLPVRERDTLPNGTSVLANRVIGDPNPDLIASLLNTFELGPRLELTVLFDGRFGNDVANFTRRITEFFGSDKVLEREINGDTIPRTFSRNPAGRINIYEEYIEDGSYVKLREVSVRYRFDQPWIRRLGAATMDIRLSGRNLVTWTNYRGLDPEINLFANNTVARGVDFANTPNPRSFILSVQFQF